MKELNLNQMETVSGGVSRMEYCGTLISMWTTGGYQGGFSTFAAAWTSNCGNYGFDFEAEQ